MKRTVMLMVVAACLSTAASEEYRTFTGTDGREIKAKIIKVDARSGKITVERDNRRKVTVPTDVFSEADQTYIKGWSSAQGFLSNSKLRISLVKKKGKTGDDKSQTKRPKPPIHYEIVMENRSGAPLSGMRLEYCMFMNSENLAGGKDRLDVTGGASESIRLEDRGRHILETKEVELFRYYTAQTDVSYDSSGYPDVSTSYNKKAEDNLEGIRVRAYLTTPSGNTFMREICEPDSVEGKYAWKDPSLSESQGCSR